MPVTILEEIPLHETREAIAALRRLRLPVRRIAVNKFRAGGVSKDIEQAVAECELDSLPPWLLPAAAEWSAYKTQTECLEQLKTAFKLPLVCFPNLPLAHPKDTFLADLVSHW